MCIRQGKYAVRHFRPAGMKVTAAGTNYKNEDGGIFCRKPQTVLRLCEGEEYGTGILPAVLSNTLH